ncbi:MAG: XRE family transcriptional regulator [Firmicutes bacterium HGW-Firmicutes-4]|jgi:transcriptional regulator with XRE-family HTH domain|nr:MAG: XRE family transcriptional regulator [Firmicutes bacterium HGW-Firmicutes-4]
MNIGDRIKKERKQCGMTQEQLALEAGVTQRCVSHYERGQREPQFVAIGKIMEAMGFQMQFVKEGVECE